MKNCLFALRLINKQRYLPFICHEREFHQLFVPGRSGEARDVMIDFSGAVLGIALSTLVSF